ncbi:MAG: DUF6573 family protein [Pirellulales bacterium]
MNGRRTFAHEDILYSYTRAEALADGVLLDITTLAKEAGIISPTAITAAAWATAVEPPRDSRDQSIEGRTWDILQVLRSTARNAGKRSRIDFIIRVKEQAGVWRDVPLKALAHPGDSGEPVISILLPYED